MNCEELQGSLPAFSTDDERVSRAWKLALEDLLYNVCLFQDGLLKEKKPVMLAGSGYDTPWTRDASINTWNGAGLLLPEVAKNTLLSVLVEEEPAQSGASREGNDTAGKSGVTGAGEAAAVQSGATGAGEAAAVQSGVTGAGEAAAEQSGASGEGETAAPAAPCGAGRRGRVRVGGQYWDAVIWVTGAWNYWLYTGDESWYDLMRECAVNSLAYFEGTEWDEEMGLFRGPACYGDGIAAYPDRYVTGESGILAFPRYFPEKCADKGVGIPMFTLSTNCLYAEAYRLACRLTGDMAYQKKSESLKARINEVFWNEKKGLYDYAVDRWGREDRQEALGQSFAILFGVADEKKRESILKNIEISPNGITCLYPTYERYLPYGIGRHSGTVWPFAQAFFADAAAGTSPERFAFEFEALTRNALRSGQFAEIYHPETGEPYGGFQEAGGPIQDCWDSVSHQTWSATGYLRMVLLDLAGLHFEEGGIRVRPVKVPQVNTLTLTGLKYRGAVIDLEITPSGWTKSAWIPADAEGRVTVRL